MQHIFIIGAKSFGAYGGYETFVNKLTEYHQDNKEIKYHIACKTNGKGGMSEANLDIIRVNDNEFIYHNAHCFKIGVPNIGSADAIYYDLASLQFCLKYIKENNIKKPIVYVLACRIGPFIGYFKNRIHRFGGILLLNPDGHEWLRQKWNCFIRSYWKLSEMLMVKHSDYIICDSLNIEKYILNSYKKFNPKSYYIAYGAEMRKSILADDSEKIISWYQKNGLNKKEYYLIVGRFVPENNYETIIREYMKSNSKRNLVIITNTNEKFLDSLEKKLHFKNDDRIKFVGTVYDQELLLKIRENAYAYFHGHEVGGTNPSLLESLASTDLNLVLDVEFNKEVAGDAALYWKKDLNNLKTLINSVESLSIEEIKKYGNKAKRIIKDKYNWNFICNKYKELFDRLKE